MTRNRWSWTPPPGLVLVLLTAVISGVSTFVNLYAVKGSDAFLTARNLLVAGLLVPLVFLASPAARPKLRRRDWGRLAAIGLIGGAIPFLLFFRGMAVAAAAGGAATASFGFRTLFLMAALLAVVFLRERVPRRAFLGAVALLAGNALLLSLTEPVWTDGTAYVLMATALWAVEYTMSKRALRDLPAATVAAGRMGIGALFLVGYLGLSGQLGALGAFSGAQLGWIVVSGVLLFAFVGTWYWGLKHVDVSTATSVLVLAFPITWALSVLAGQAAFTVEAAVGTVVIAFGVALVVGLASVRESVAYVVRALDRVARRA